MASILDNAYELQNSWTPTSDPTKLSAAEIKAVDDIIIRDGKYGKQMVFFMTNGKKKVFNLSPYSEQYSAGTHIRPSSVEVQELRDDEGTVIYRASGKEA